MNFLAGSTCWTSYRRSWWEQAPASSSSVSSSTSLRGGATTGARLRDGGVELPRRSVRAKAQCTQAAISRLNVDPHCLVLNFIIIYDALFLGFKKGVLGGILWFLYSSRENCFARFPLNCRLCNMNSYLLLSDFIQR